MASIHIDTTIQAPAPQVWAALAAVGEAHKTFAGVLSACHLEGDDVRVVTFANGLQVKEQIVTIDPVRMRIAYAAIGTDLKHHSAAMQIIPATDGTCRFDWMTDVLPHEAVEWIRPLMEQGARALAANLQTAHTGAVAR